MKAHALSLSLLLAVLPALSHPPAVPAADARQPQESWQRPWAEGGSGPGHSYRGPVREEFLQCERGQCPLPVHEGTAPACGTGGALPPAVAPAASLRQDEPVARAGLGERRARRLQKGRRHMRSKGSRPGQKHHPRPPRPAVPLPPERAWRPGQREIPPRRRPPGIRPKRGSPPLLSPLPDRRQARCPGPRRRQSLLRPEMRPLYPAQTARPVTQRGTRPRPSSTKRLPIRRDWSLYCRAVWTKAWPVCRPCWSSILPGRMRPMPNTGWERPCPARAGTKRLWRISVMWRPGIPGTIKMPMPCCVRG